jgi:hypothetical protein
MLIKTKTTFSQINVNTLNKIRTIMLIKTKTSTIGINP